MGYHNDRRATPEETLEVFASLAPGAMLRDWRRTINGTPVYISAATVDTLIAEGAPIRRRDFGPATYGHTSYYRAG